MVAISGFPACCGASIITGFDGNPEAGVTFETEVIDGKWGPIAVPKRDAKGQPIIKETYQTQFLKNLTDHKKGGDHAYFAILNERQLQTKWPEILRDCGFEFSGRWNNSNHGVSPNYLFVCPKNGSGRRIPGFNEPPKRWLDLQAEKVESKAA